MNEAEVFSRENNNKERVADYAQPMWGFLGIGGIEHSICH
jgi:hypothetical protein